MRFVSGFVFFLYFRQPVFSRPKRLQSWTWIPEWQTLVTVCQSPGCDLWVCEHTGGGSKAGLSLSALAKRSLLDF